MKAEQSKNEQYSRIQQLSGLIEKYQKSYYAGEAEISDEEFDTLWDELKSLDPENSVLVRIGSDVIETGGVFSKARHIIPMGSQEKAADPVSFMQWAQKMSFSEFLVEYKLDGASIELQYENGKFIKAVTRGDGEIGDDITRNAVKMNGVLPELRKNGILLPYTGGIRGEVIMTRLIHDTLYPDKANCRNAANGLMKRKDGTGSEHLCVICYDAFFPDIVEAPFSSEDEKLHWLTDCGFDTVPSCICSSAEEVISYRAKIMDMRPSLGYDIDGLVIKGLQIDEDDARRARPEKQIAFKFSLEEAVSVVRSVQWSESGATYTPIALFDTVELAGTKVSRASLVNPNTVRSLNICIGSRVVVTKRGEIIPKIEYVVKDTNENGECKNESESPIVFPSVCSSCGTPLSDEGTRLFCPSPECPKLILHRLEKWVSVLDIRDFGTTLIGRLFNSGRVRSVSDIYTLTPEELVPYFLNEESVAKEKKSLGAVKVHASIFSKTTISLSKFIAGFDIEGIGETLVDKLVEAGFDTLEKLLSADEGTISAVNGFGDITAHALCSGLRACTHEMTELTKPGGPLSIIQRPAGGKLSGLSFCFTGELYTMKRQEAAEKAVNAGGTVKTSVVKGLSYLVTNDTSSGSSKNKKAAELGVSVIDEKTFLGML